ncbi:MAG TPA: hypothetical protein VI540_07095 [Gaiellaceae bacterium]|nr:hypothetical protein [Gaiellaceae bacterium]
MPRIIELVYHNVDVERGSEVDPQTLATVSSWTIVYQDQRTGDLTRFTFGEQIRDFIVKGLMAGIQVASELPDANGRVAGREPGGSGSTARSLVAPADTRT